MNMFSEFSLVWGHNMAEKWYFDLYCGNEYQQAPVNVVARYTMLEF